MNIDATYEKEIVGIILFTSVFFIIMSVVMVVFFYFSRKKIVQKELEKKDLEIQYQKEQLRAIIITQEEERKRIAQDLHDDISSKLNIVSLNSHLLKTPNLTSSEIAVITNNIIDLSAKVLDNSRRIAHDLLPPVLDKFGLHAGIEELCQEFNSSKSVAVNYRNDIELDPLQKERHLHVFRILQELMNNSLRHGKAKKINVFLEEINGINICKYSDDGIGFDREDKKNQNGLGMKNIESRVIFLNSTMTIESAVNKGINVEFSF